MNGLYGVLFKINLFYISLIRRNIFVELIVERLKFPFFATVCMYIFTTKPQVPILNSAPISQTTWKRTSMKNTHQHIQFY